MASQKADARHLVHFGEATQLILGALTDEYQSVSDVAVKTGLTVSRVNFVMPTLIRCGLIDFIYVRKLHVSRVHIRIKRKETQ